MTFLKKFGQAFLKYGMQIVGFAPLAQAVFPGQAGQIQTVSQDLAQICNIITQVEAAAAAAQLPGTVKFQMAGPLVGQIIAQSAVLVGKKIANPALYQQSINEFTQATVDLLNSLHEDGVKTSDALL